MLVRSGYCAQHKPPARRGADSKAWHAWYSLSIWTDRLRPAQLLRQPFCAACAAQGRRERATDVDHIAPHQGDWQKFVNPANHQSLCHSCHSRKTMREMRESRARF